MADEGKYYDANGKRLRRKRYIRFNPSESFYRDTTIFGKIVRVDEKTGAITYLKVPAFKEVVSRDTTYSEVVLLPDTEADLSDELPQKLNLKRGKAAKSGLYRYDGRDVHVYRIDPDELYVCENCY